MTQARIDTPTGGSSPRLIAFYLPQFHPIPENDAWWGEGFTEWTNVTKAQPLFPGHYQPHLPTELGFYDLRVREVRHQQIALARQYGIDAFCYHYYWFSGKRLLERPLDEMLADREADMPFCLCWANENWSRRWDGAEQDLLIAQRELPEDDLNFIKSVEPYLRDPRYLRVDGAPLLIVYCPQNIRDPRHSVQVWREYCAQAGIGPLHLCAALTHGNTEYLRFGFDSGVEFPPHNTQVANINHRIRFAEPFVGHAIDFRDLAPSNLQREYFGGKVFKTVFPSWDNTARTGHRAVMILNATPNNYEWWLKMAFDKASAAGGSDQLVFINAWNEWAEGCHLEPDRRYGRAYLEATLRVKNGVSTVAAFDVDPLFTAFNSSADEVHRKFFADAKEIAVYHWLRFWSRSKAALNRYPRVKRQLKKAAVFFR